MDVVVVSDDRTSAFEAASLLADRGLGAVPVAAWRPHSPEPPHLARLGDGVAVLDLATRHMSPADAADRAASIPTADRQAHKIDSALRGNWADELAARSRVAPVLLVPALPASGRTCVDGVVYDHGRPIHEDAAPTDVLRRIRTARPAEIIRSAGQHEVVELHDLATVNAWLDDPTGVAVADAESDATIAAIVDAWNEAPTSTVLAGTPAVISAMGTVLAGSTEPPVLPPVDGPILIVCGSVHPVARRQVAHAEHRGIAASYLADELTAKLLARDGVLILAIEIPVGDDRAPIAVAATASLARGVADLRRLTPLGALVLVGGDTASAVLGDAPVRGLGTIDEGTAWIDVDGFDATVLTRSGGYGSDSALTDLVWRLRRP